MRTKSQRVNVPGLNELLRLRKKIASVASAIAPTPPPQPKLHFPVPTRERPLSRFAGAEGIGRDRAASTRTFGLSKRGQYIGSIQPNNNFSPINKTLQLQQRQEQQWNLMSAQPLENRVAMLESEMAQLKQNVETQLKGSTPWWQEITGTFANEPAFDEAMELGRQYRESLRPQPNSVETENVSAGH